MHLVCLTGLDNKLGILAIAQYRHKKKASKAIASTARKGVRRRAPSASLGAVKVSSEGLEPAQPGAEDDKCQQRRRDQRKLGEPVEEDVVAEADEQQQQHVTVSAGGQGIEDE